MMNFEAFGYPGNSICPLLRQNRGVLYLGDSWSPIKPVKTNNTDAAKYIQLNTYVNGQFAQNFWKNIGSTTIQKVPTGEKTL